MRALMQQPALAPPTPPSPPPASPLQGRFTIVGGGDGGPTAVYRAQVAMRKELGDQLERLQDTRRELASNLSEEGMSSSARTGIEARIAATDARIAALDKQIADADAKVAQAAGIPGAVVEEPPPQFNNNGPPEEAFVIGGLFIVCAVLPISIAFARRIWRRSAAAVTALPQEMMDRLTRLDQAVDAIAVEVERIGEGQRFMTRVLAEKPAAAAALGTAAEQRERR
jgi:hypothetical protein